jgi:hypothetical protein
MKATKSVLCGIVVRFNENHNSGVVRVYGQKWDLQFSMDSQRVLVDGIHEPQFGDKAPKETFIPKSECQIVVRLGERVDFKRRSQLCVDAWNYLFEYQDSRRRIAERPRYRIFQTAYLNGRPIPDAGRYIGKGTLPELKSMWGGNSLPERVMDLAYNYRVEKLEGGKWTLAESSVKLELGLRDGNPSPTNGQLQELVHALVPQSRGRALQIF